MDNNLEIHAVLVFALLMTIGTVFKLASLWLDRLAAREDLLPCERKPREDAVVTGGTCVMVTALGLFAAAEAALVLFDAKGHGIFVLLYASAACLAAGAGLGFLFGIPHAGAPRVTDSNNGTTTPDSGYQSSTSLEQIADWLTKIIVGVGLVELSRIYEFFKTAVKFLAAALGEPLATASACAATTLVFFPIVGFLGCYLITRLYLAAALVRADTDTKSAFEKAGVSPKNARDLPKGTSDLLFGLLTDHGKGTATLSDTDREIIESMAKVEFKDLKTADEFSTWGLAKLVSGGVADAQKALLRATELKPDSAEFSLAYAVSLNEGGAPGAEVEKVLRKALANITGDTNRIVRKNIYKSLTYRLLYRDDAYAEVIRLGEEYRNTVPAAESGGILVNLACAYGQQLTALRQESLRVGTAVPAAQEKEIRDKALDAIANALRIDNHWLNRLQLLMYRNHPDKIANTAFAEENDLEVFADDPEFIRIVPSSVPEP